MAKRRTAAASLVCLFTFCGCNVLDSLSKDDGEKEVKQAARELDQVRPNVPAATATATASATPTAPPVATRPLPEGRTPIPTPEEWAAVPKEVTVKGSSALNCETKMIREYLRVRCSGANDTGGKPTTVQVKKGGGVGAITTAAEGVTNLIVPFTEGTDFAAVFSWTDKSHRLAARWPNGAPKPTIIAIFEGAASPIDAAFDQATARRLCECIKQATSARSCADSLASPNVDCFRTYEKECGKLVACSRGERSVPPRCQAGFVNGGALNWCMKVCGPSDPCPSGESCTRDGNVSYCL